MPLTSTSIKRPVTVAMFYIAIALIGIYAFSKIGVDLLPNINIPHLLIQTTYPDASPEEIKLSDKFLKKPFSKVFYINNSKILTALIPIPNNNKLSEKFYRS
jgi:HAE1 family hydrophobic/amphiphilic exporter-1